MIISVQILSKVLDTKDYSIIEDNILTKDMFVGYEKEYEFIAEHYHNYGSVPDKESFLGHFPNFELADVSESDEYLVAEIREQNLFDKSVEAIQKAADLLQEDSNKAVEFLRSALDTSLQPHYSFHDEEIISNVTERVEHSKNIASSKGDFFIPTGFEEIDNDTNGLQRGNELVVIFARINNGKSWVSEKIAKFIAEIGYNVGYFSPEMSARDLGYRFDTLHGNLSNNQVRLGRFNDEFSIEDYEEYAESLKKINGKFYVTKPKDFARKVTVSKLRNWIKQRQLDILFIDGIKYLTDERYRRGDSTTISLTNISEDLMDLSEEMGIPIVVVVQANRGGVLDKNSLETPELENIKDSDGIAANASIVWAIRQVKTDTATFLLIDNKKMRNGENGQSYKYRWDIDRGKFESVTAEDIDVKQEENYSQYVKEEKEVSGGNKRDRRRKVEDDY